MKRSIIFLLAWLAAAAAAAQPARPDAFPPAEEVCDAKSLAMATTLDEMFRWDRYPTYDVYVEMMNLFAETYPSLCRLDTIGLSVQGRLILTLVITGSEPNDIVRPEFFYTSTMHGDELTGFYFMLRLCDTLLSSYGTSSQITDLLNRVVVYINPLSNPDGTYRGGNHTVANAMRYNARFADLNRNFPNPFGTEPLESIQPENTAMMDYASRHHFAMSANLHGGSEVMNYPWDSFTSAELQHPQAEWWKAVCKRYVDTCRKYNPDAFRNVNDAGYIAGGDWYVIYNGRQDYFNHEHHTLELTMELSVTKKLPSELLATYWNFQSHALINYIGEILSLPDTSTQAAHTPQPDTYQAYPNPTRGTVNIVTPTGTHTIDLTGRPAGLHIIPIEGHPVKIVKF